MIRAIIAAIGAALRALALIPFWIVQRFGQSLGMRTGETGATPPPASATEEAGPTNEEVGARMREIAAIVRAICAQRAADCPYVMPALLGGDIRAWIGALSKAEAGEVCRATTLSVLEHLTGERRLTGIVPPVAAPQDMAAWRTDFYSVRTSTRQAVDHLTADNDRPRSLAM